jgi:hypothetical protein
MNTPSPVPRTQSSSTGTPLKRLVLWVLLLLVAVALVAAAWMLMRPDARRAAPGALSAAPPAGLKPPTTPADAATATPPAPVPPSPSGVAAKAGAADGSPGAPGSPRYPIDRVMSADAPIDPATSSLDATTSDKAIIGALGSFPGREQILKWILPSDIARRFVLTVDNLTGDSMSMQYRAVVATPGQFQVENRNGEPAISTKNTVRYAPFVEWVSRMDAQRAVALYKRFYPLLQKTYQDIGFPDRHFNDRVVEAIDDLLAAPSPTGAVFLNQPRVLYEYAESSLERRSVGQRMLIRMGAEHSSRIKTKLQEIRTLLTQEK